MDDKICKAGMPILKILISFLEYVVKVYLYRTINHGILNLRSTMQEKPKPTTEKTAKNELYQRFLDKLNQKESAHLKAKLYK